MNLYQEYFYQTISIYINLYQDLTRKSHPPRVIKDLEEQERGKEGEKENLRDLDNVSAVI